MRFRKKLLSVIALMVALTMMPSLAAMGLNFPFEARTTASLRLRQNPSTTAVVKLTMPAGALVTVTGESGDFYAITYNGTSGYAAKEYLQIETTAALLNEEPLYETLKNGCSGTEVKQLQTALKNLGFYTSSIDGKYGSGTQNAVSSFQKKNGMSATGIADTATLTLLYDGNPINSKGKPLYTATPTPIVSVNYTTLSNGSKGEAVKQLQIRLKELGYYSSSIDGSYGSGTKNAVSSFQKKNGLSQTGIADATTQYILYSSQAVSANAKTATATPSPTPTPNSIYPYTTYTLTSVNLRASASTSSTKVTTLGKGAEITVYGTVGDFLQVVSNGKSGYIMAIYASIPSQYLQGKTLAVDSEARQKYPFLSSGSSGDQVTALQKALRELGFFSGTVDGKYGTATISAMNAFQKANGLAADGIASPEIQKLIYEEKPINSAGKTVTVSVNPPIEGYELKQGDTGAYVVKLQDALRALGFYTGMSNGIYDINTKNAVTAFQKKHSLMADGIAGQKTQKLLYELTTTPTPVPYGVVTQQPIATPLTEDNVIVLRNGTRGVAVQNVQKRLIELGYYNCTVDGIYNSDDIAAVRAFQRKNGLTIDGVAGYTTQKLLFSDVALPATDTVTATAAPNSSRVITFFNTNQTLRYGNSGTDVQTLQQKLKELGYYNSYIDSIYGTSTVNAVKLFQKSYGLTVDGTAGPKTLEMIFSSSVNSTNPIPTVQPTATPAASIATVNTSKTLRYGDRGTYVLALQNSLTALGYMSSADGIYGNDTKQAVMKFQRQNGLAVDGIAGSTTLSRLNSVMANAVNSAINSTVSSGTYTTVDGFRVPNASEVRYANWYNEIRERARLMPDVVIYDPESGLHYNLHMFSFGKHADAEPPTAEDTEIMYQVCGYDNWDAKYVWVIFSDGRVYIASTHSHGHEVDHTAGNDLTGHICIHFPRNMSEAEETGPYAVSHQEEILWGWELTQAMIR